MVLRRRLVSIETGSPTTPMGSQGLGAALSPGSSLDIGLDANLFGEPLGRRLYVSSCITYRCRLLHMCVLCFH